jgi:hypothetical protein
VAGAVGWAAAGLLDDAFTGQRRADYMFRRNALASGLKFAVLLVLSEAAAKHGSAVIVATWALAGMAGTVYGLYLCHRHIYRLGWIRLPEGGLARALFQEMALLARPSLGHHAIIVSGLLPTYLLPLSSPPASARCRTRTSTSPG